MKNIKIPNVSREDLEIKGIVNSNLFSSIALNRFPEDLSPEKAIKIHVYNTSKADNVYNGLIDTTQNVLSSGANLFGKAAQASSSWLGSIGDNPASSITSTLGKVLGNITIDMPKAAGGLFGTNNSGLGDMISSTFVSFGKLNVGIGNAKLFNRYNYYETFFLPIPNDIQESISNDYEEQEGWVNDAPMMGKDETIRSGIEKGTEMVATWSKLSGARSLKYWENKIQMYSSSSFREISLSWQMSPNNIRESRTIHELVRKIKMYGSPESAAGKILLKSPCYFGIEFNNKTLNDALQFQEVVLVSASIEYVPGGHMETFYDGKPKHIQVSLVFRDRQPKLQEDWASPLSQSGPSSNENSCPQK